MTTESQACGTYAGWNWHKNHDETPCDDCYQARRVYMRYYRFTRGNQRDPWRCITCGSVFPEHICGGTA